MNRLLSKLKSRRKMKNFWPDQTQNFLDIPGWLAGKFCVLDGKKGSFYRRLGVSKDV